MAPVKLGKLCASMEAGSESVARVFERVIQAQGRLLRVERVPLLGPAGARASSALRLTFDAGILTLRLDGEGIDLEVETTNAGRAEPEVFVSASEDDPWWRVMGAPLTRVQVRAEGGVRLQFRSDDDQPRRFALFSRYDGIESSLDS